MSRNNDWNEWKHHVLSEIKRGNDNHKEVLNGIKKIDEKIVKISIDLLKMKTKEQIKNAIFGVFGGGVAIAFSEIVHTFFKWKNILMWPKEIKFFKTLPNKTIKEQKEFLLARKIIQK